MPLHLRGPLPRSVEAIVDQQVRAFHLKNRAERKGREVPPRIITVSREFGAGGARVAKRVADQLGFSLWDRALIQQIAERAGADPRFVEAIDERERDLLDDVIATSLLPRAISGMGYRMILTRTVAELAEHGAAVIVGRGATFLVDPAKALRVRVVCPLSIRIDRYATREGISLSESERTVLQKDRERERFVRQLCRERGDDPTHYDLVINTAIFNEEQAAQLIIDAYTTRFGAIEATRASAQTQRHPS